MNEVIVIDGTSKEIASAILMGSIERMEAAEAASR